MKAVILKDTGKYQVVEKPIPDLVNDDDILAEIECSSICGSDVHILADPPGIRAEKGVTIGHEMVCRVVKTGKRVTAFSPGERFVHDPNLSCGTCSYCQMGMPNMCRNMVTQGVDLDGAFSEYIVVPEHAAVKISPEIPAEKAIFAEPLNCVLSAVDKARLLPGESVLILGGGPIGQYFARLLRLNGAGKVMMSEISEYRSRFAVKSRVDVVINPASEHLVERVKEETGGMGADVVIDAVGCLVNDAIACARCGGKILLFGNNQAACQNISQSQITLKELTVLGSYIGRYAMPATVKLLEKGLLDLDDLITHRIALGDFQKGIEAMRKGEAMEVVIYPE